MCMPSKNVLCTDLGLAPAESDLAVVIGGYANNLTAGILQGQLGAE